MAFRLDRNHEKKLDKENSLREENEYQEILDRMSAYIYMELDENRTEINLNRVVTNYWEVYRSELGNWKESEITKIIRVYNLLDSYSRRLETQNYTFNADIKRLIIDVLRWFDDKAEKNERFKEILKEVRLEYSETKRIEQTGELNYNPKF
jgi:hypothetical protein